MGTLDPLARFFGKQSGQPGDAVTSYPLLPSDSTLPHLPLHTDWVLRPAPWATGVDQQGDAAGSGTEIAPGAKLFHDDTLARIALGRHVAKGPPFALAIDVNAFAGSFLSLAVEFPAAGAAGLKRRQILQAETRVEAPGVPEVYLRLNIRHGANIERMPQSIQPGRPQVAEFDLFHAPFFEGAVDVAWIDLIFTRPAPGRIVIGDLVLSRRPRPEI